jgi:hypothetical protein
MSRISTFVEVVTRIVHARLIAHPIVSSGGVGTAAAVQRREEVEGEQPLVVEVNASPPAPMSAIKLPS